MEKNLKKLTDIEVGKEVIIAEVLSKGLSKQRLLDLGFIPDTKIYVLRKSTFGEPVAYFIRDTCIALRKEETDTILVY